MFLMISQHEQPSSHPHHFHLAAISEAFDYDTVFGFLSKNSEFLLCFFAPACWPSSSSFFAVRKDCLVSSEALQYTTVLEPQSKEPAKSCVGLGPGAQPDALRLDRSPGWDNLRL